MNIVIAIGKILEVNQDGKVLRFVLTIREKKPCNLPCLIFNPNEEVTRLLDQLKSTAGLVSVKGRLLSDEFEYQGRLIRKVEVVTYPQSVTAL